MPVDILYRNDIYVMYIRSIFQGYSIFMGGCNISMDICNTIILSRKYYPRSI